MTDTARVVIIGGGIWGCSIAYHLARAGVSDVLVVERGELASGNTSQAAGLVGQLRASELMARSIMAVVDRLSRWQTEHGEDSGFRQVGSLKLALTDARVRELEAQVAQARRWGLAVELIAPRDAQTRVPLLETNGVKACVWIPTDGYAEPYTLAMALARAARRLGVRMRTQTPVTGITLNRERVTGIETASGPITCETVVVAVGPWSELIGAVLGLRFGSLLIGQWMSELIVDGKTSVDLSTQALTRFGSRYGSRGRLQGDCESIYANFYALDKGAF